MERVKHHPILGDLLETKSITFQFNGQDYNAVVGDTVVSALLVNNIRELREHEETGSKRGVYCNIGHCFECRVNVNGEQNIRACLTLVEEGMAVFSRKKLTSPLKNEGEIL